MAKTFDNISESSATNYLFLFAQRTLALQNELPTPPPLNVLGLPCHALCLLWDLLQKEDGTRKKTDETALEATATEAIGFDKARSSVGSWSFSTGSWSFATGSVAAQGDEKLPIEREAMLEDRAAAEASAEGTQRSSAETVGKRTLSAVAFAAMPLSFADAAFSDADGSSTSDGAARSFAMSRCFFCFCFCTHAQSRKMALHGSPSAFSGGGVGGSFWRASVLCANRKR